MESANEDDGARPSNNEEDLDSSQEEDSRSASDVDSWDNHERDHAEEDSPCCSCGSCLDSYAEDWEEEEEEEERSGAESALFQGIWHRDAAAVRCALQNGANVNCFRYYAGDEATTPLLEACKKEGSEELVRILLEAGANARASTHSEGWSAMFEACHRGHLSTLQSLMNHDTGLLEIANRDDLLFFAITTQKSHPGIVRFLLDRGVCATDSYGTTALMHACTNQREDLEMVRLLLAAGADVAARDERQQTALHYAAPCGSVEAARELILQHNANLFPVDVDGTTPFDCACRSSCSVHNAAYLLDVYGNKVAQEEGQLALHAILGAAKYSFVEAERFHPPLNPTLKIILPLGKLTLEHLRTLLHRLDTELIRHRDDNGKLPIHIACQANAPVQVLSMLVEIDPATLHIADHGGALPLHLLCGTRSEHASVRYLVEQGGVGTLAARHHHHRGALPLHVLCASTRPPLRTVQYLMQSFPGSLAAQTKAGEYPFMIAACESSSASLSVVYELARANPGLVIPN